jgi:hypothetical protein
VCGLLVVFGVERLGEVLEVRNKREERHAPLLLLTPPSPSLPSQASAGDSGHSHSLADSFEAGAAISSELLSEQHRGHILVRLCS